MAPARLAFGLLSVMGMHLARFSSSRRTDSQCSAKPASWRSGLAGRAPRTNSLGVRSPAFGYEHGAGHEGGRARGQEGGDAADVVGIADAPQRRGLQPRLEALLVLPQRAREVGLHQAGGDAIDAHVLGTPLDGEA